MSEAEGEVVVDTLDGVEAAANTGKSPVLRFTNPEVLEAVIARRPVPVQVGTMDGLHTVLRRLTRQNGCIHLACPAGRTRLYVFTMPAAGHTTIEFAKEKKGTRRKILTCSGPVPFAHGSGMGTEGANLALLARIFDAAGLQMRL